MDTLRQSRFRVVFLVIQVFSWVDARLSRSQPRGTWTRATPPGGHTRRHIPCAVYRDEPSVERHLADGTAECACDYVMRLFRGRVPKEPVVGIASHDNAGWTENHLFIARKTIPVMAQGETDEGSVRLTLDSYTKSLESFGIILNPFGLSGVRKEQIQVLAGNIRS